MKLAYDYGILPRYCAAFLTGLVSSLPDPARVVEIGTYMGNSTVAILRGLTHHEDAFVWTIDITDRPEADELISKALFKRDRYERIVANSIDVAKDWPHGNVDMVYVDGDHQEESVRADIHSWLQHIRPGGIIVFDDFQTPNWAGATKAINAIMFHTNDWRLIGQVGRCIAFERVAGVGAWQSSIGQWRQFWPDTIKWQEEQLGVDAWRWVNYGWQWPKYPELPASQWQVRGENKPTSEIDTKSTEDLTPEEISTLTEEEKAIRGLVYSTSIYNRDWYALQSWQHNWVQKAMGWFVGEYGPFEKSLDLGAGDGYYSYVLNEMKTLAYAVEVSEEAAEFIPEEVWFVPWDLRTPLHIGEHYDLVICLEVAEHLPEVNANTLCDTIAEHATNMLLFTAAPPGQGGHGHVNLQYPEYWISKLAQRGIYYLEEETVHIRTSWKRIMGESLPWLWKNAMVFRKNP